MEKPNFVPNRLNYFDLPSDINSQLLELHFTVFDIRCLICLILDIILHWSGDVFGMSLSGLNNYVPVELMILCVS